MNLLKKIHNDEEGLEVLQVVIILAIAAIVCFAIKTFFSSIKSWSNERIDKNILQFKEG